MEIKSAETFSNHFLKNIKFYHEISGDRAPKSFLIYAGREDHMLNTTEIIHFQDMELIWKQITEDT